MSLGFDFEEAVNAHRRERGLDPVDTDRDGTVDSGTDTLDDTVWSSTNTNDSDTNDTSMSTYDPRRDPRNWDSDTTNAPDEGDPYMEWPDTFVGVRDGTGGVHVPGNGPTERTNPGGDDTVNDWSDVRESVMPGDGSDPSGGMALLAIFVAGLAALAALVRD